MGPIVCCLDDSDGARRALATARELASGLGAELLLVHVAPPTEAPGVSAAAAGQARLRGEELRTGEELLARLSREAGLSGRSRSRTAVGRAAETIVAVCEDEAAGLVVIGSRGRRGLTAAVLGSVSATVAATAPCPCVVVPP
jgi:nucleotide-binding universal stress UspA family protein